MFKIIVVCLAIVIAFSVFSTSINHAAGLFRPDDGAVGLALEIRENEITQFELDGALTLSEAERNLAEGYAAQVTATAALENAGNGRIIAIAIFFLALALVAVSKMAA